RKLIVAARARVSDHEEGVPGSIRVVRPEERLVAERHVIGARRIRVRRPGTETVDGDGADRVGPALDHAAARSLGRPDGEGAAGRCIGVPDDRDRAGGEELQVWPARERRGSRRWRGEEYGQRN